jgi:hypothetical protein
VYTATLSCGTTLIYEARSLAPSGGETVPCRHHGYCDVRRSGRAADPASGRRFLARARPKEQGELTEWLRGRSVTTVHVLRRHRFTLRMIAAAERDGLVAVDLETGRVTVR